MINNLTFNTLRDGNVARLPLFKNAQGEPAHSEPDGSDWSIAQWVQAVVGELGEFANINKKVDRGDFSMPEAIEEHGLADELADVAIYLDILAFRCGVDLGRAVQRKWNRTSAKVDCNLRIDHDGVHTIKVIGGPPKPDLMLVHWPGESIVACRKHQDQINQLAGAMGMPEPTATEAPPGAVCVNCQRESGP